MSLFFILPSQSINDWRNFCSSVSSFPFSRSLGSSLLVPISLQVAPWEVPRRRGPAFLAGLLLHLGDQIGCLLGRHYN